MGNDNVWLVRTDVSEARIASTIRVKRISKLGTTLAITSNRSALRRNTVTHTHTHGVTSQKTAFFIVTDIKTSNLT
jgi:hypothetical protein